MYTKDYQNRLDEVKKKQQAHNRSLESRLGNEN